MATAAEYGLGPIAFPRGWFMVATSEEVTSVPSSVRFFGQDLVLYRGESGAAYMVDAYCPHLGAHLAKNTSSFVIKDNKHVEGECIRCPYHAWRFGPDGKCNEIPYSPARPPEAAKLRYWRVEERYGCIFAWHDAEGGVPDFNLPVISQWDNPAYLPWEIDHLGDLPCHPIELIDNMADLAHLAPTHGSEPSDYFSNQVRGVELWQLQAARNRMLVNHGALRTDTYYTGPGILISRFNGGQGIMFITHTPVEDGSLRAWHGFIMNSGNPAPGEAEREMARQASAGSLAALAQDFEVWANKRPCFDPLAVLGDGGFSKVRAWYKQFYHPRADAERLQKLANGTYGARGTPAAPEELLRELAG
ncbi:MAG: (2Fe-2S)-binding protein [Rhodovulum sulfidophilum]|uniref:(2Fe-2S)-binding protein n=1 Tax=Rhodovulum sulfidophilum TaxID=35806 RepID=A0A2W5MX64_RHOSU|nr:MAG: (2Fe-2S)-binding protein [Rhodovulum sulfidophilum]